MSNLFWRGPSGHLVTKYHVFTLTTSLLKCFVLRKSGKNHTQNDDIRQVLSIVYIQNPCNNLRITKSSPIILRHFVKLSQFIKVKQN